MLPVSQLPVPRSVQSDKGSSNELGQLSSPENSMKRTLVRSSGQLPPEPLDEPLPRPLDAPPEEASDESPPDPLDEPGAGPELPLEHPASTSRGSASAAPAPIDEAS
jgi:hypothetical protein